MAASTQFSNRIPGAGATQSTGFSLGVGQSTGGNNLRGGGGGGYYGGSVGDNSTGGGGGSGFVASSLTSTTLTAGNASMPNPAGGTMVGNSGNGTVRITYLNVPVPSSFTSTQSTPTNSTSAISFSITMSQNVTGMADNDFLNAGTATGCAYTVSGSGASYTLTVSSCGPGTVIPALRTNAVFGTVTSTNGPASDAQTSTPITIDRTAPTISSVTAPANNTYGPGQNLTFTVNMSEATNVTTTGGTPSLAVTIGSTARSATYRSGTGTSALVFTYTVQTSDLDIDTDGIAIATSLSLNGGAIADLATNAATLSLTAPNMTSVRVAQVPAAPTITSIASNVGSLSVNFTSGADNGAIISNYQYSLNGGAWTSRSPVATTSPMTISGLTNGVGYTVAIRATNAIGAGTASTTSTSVVVNSPLTLSGGSNVTTLFGTAATTTFTSTGGAGTKTWTILRASDGLAINGITINSSGVVSVANTTAIGVYSVKVTVTDATGASLTSAITITVNGLTLTITAASPSTVAYGTAIASPAFTATGLNASDSITALTYTYSGSGSTIYSANTTPPTAAGTYSVTPSAVGFSVSGTASKYSTINYNPGYFTIAKKALTVSPSNTTITYGTASPSFTPTILGFVGSESASTAAGYVAPTCSISGYSATSNVGSTFTISCSGGSAANYTFTTTDTATATVGRAQLTVSPDAKSVIYGQPLPTLTFVVNGWVNSQTSSTAAGYVAPTCSTSPSYTTTTAAGTSVTISCSGGSAANYSFSSASAALTISKINTLTITAANQSITYGAATPTNSFSTAGLAASDAISSVKYRYAGSGSTTYASSETAPVLPGTYTITPFEAVFSTGAASNYTTVTYAPGTYTIGAATLTITAASPSTVAYGTAIASPAFTATGLNASDSITALTYTYSGSGSTIYSANTTPPTAAGTYSVTPSAVGFSVSGTASKYSTINYNPGYFTIAKKALTVSPSNTTITYGTASPSFTPTILGFVGSESASTAAGYVAPTCSISGYSATSNVGSTFTISCSGGSAANYTFTTTDTATATVGRAQLTVSPDAKSVIYGQPLPTLTFVVNGWVNSQTSSTAAGYVAPTCSTSPSYTTTTAAGTSVTISCSGGSAANYSFSSASAALTISKINTLTITAANQSITYGAATPTNSFSTAGLAASDAISSVKYRYAGSGSTTYASSETAPVLPGTYTITPFEAVFSTGAASNYTTVTYAPGTYTIALGRLVITAVAASSTTYGTALPNLSFTTSGLGQGSSVGSVTYSYSGTGSTIYAASSTAPTAIGTYRVTPSEAVFSTGSSNLYSAISYISAFFSITKAPLTIVPSAASVVYGATTPALSFTVEGLQYGETLSSIAGYSAPTCTSTYSTTTSVLQSPAPVSCSGGSATSYTFNSGSANVLTITPRPLSVTGTTIAARQWTGTRSPGTVSPGSLVGLINGENFTLQASASEYSDSVVGTYTSTITYTLVSLSGSVINNYSVATGTASGTINPASAEFTVTPEKVTASTAAASAFSIDYAISDTLTVSATSTTPGVVKFEVSVAGADFANIAACPNVAINPTGGAAVAAICSWFNPTLGELVIRSTLTPTDLSKNAIEVKEFSVFIVPRPTITSFSLRGSPGVTSGPIGSVVVITGTQFIGINDIKFGGVSAASGTFRATSSQITVTVPAGAIDGPITVGTKFGGTVTSSQSFDVTSTP
jgi:hypothetical protein